MQRPEIICGLFLLREPDDLKLPEASKSLDEVLLDPLVLTWAVWLH